MPAQTTPALPAPRSSRAAAQTYRRLDARVASAHDAYLRARGSRQNTGARIQSAAETRAHGRYQDALLVRSGYYREYFEMIEDGEGVLAREKAARDAR